MLVVEKEISKVFTIIDSEIHLYISFWYVHEEIVLDRTLWVLKFTIYHNYNVTYPLRLKTYITICNKIFAPSFFCPLCNIWWPLFTNTNIENTFQVGWNFLPLKRQTNVAWKVLHVLNYYNYLLICNYQSCSILQTGCQLVP